MGEKNIKRLKKESNNEVRQKNFILFEYKDASFIICFTKKSYLRNILGSYIQKINHVNGYLPIGAILYYSDNKLKVSLRYDVNSVTNQIHNEEIDLNKISNFFGGGGHKYAASFNISKDLLYNEYSKNIDIKKLTIPDFN